MAAISFAHTLDRSVECEDNMSEALDRILRDLGDLKAELASVRSEQVATNQRLDDMQANHIKGLGKRISELEEKVSQLREKYAHEDGERHGKRVVIAAVATALASLGALLGNVLNKWLG